jgi:hypothetical protein
MGLFVHIFILGGEERNGNILSQINICNMIQAHTHTKRERKRERERYGDILPPLHSLI